MIALRALTTEDAKSIFTFRSDPLVKLMYLGNVLPNNVQLEQKWIEKLPSLEPYTVTFGIENEQNTLVGFLQFKNINYINKNCEFSILIGREFHNHGYGKYASQKAKEFAFSTLNLKKMILYVLRNNVKAISMYEKLGFKKIGELSQHIFRDGKYHDLIIMEVINEET